LLNRYPLDETGQCALCRLGLNGFDEVYSAGAYEGRLRKLIHLFKFLFKFNGVQPLSRPLGRFLRQSLPRERRFGAIVPMPLHWRRRWQRGFNQSELLAREIAATASAGARALKRAGAASVSLVTLARRDRRTGIELGTDSLVFTSGGS
jgi:predicted amidophosphoribosyltransferase